LTTTLSIISGEDIPPYNDLFLFPSSTAGYFFLIICALITVVLLLNFLIALMNSIYETLKENSTQDYRWLMTQSLSIGALEWRGWPVPLNLLQLLLIGPAYYYYSDLHYRKHKIPHTRVSSTDMYGSMVISYFNLKDQK